MISSSVLLLRHLGLEGHADRISDALLKVISDGKVLTRDVGGTASTTDFTKEVIRNMQ